MTSEDQIKAVLAKHIKPWEMDGFPCVTGIPEAAAEIAALASTAGAGAGDWVRVPRSALKPFEDLHDEIVRLSGETGHAVEGWAKSCAWADLAALKEALTTAPASPPAPAEHGVEIRELSEAATPSPWSASGTQRRHEEPSCAIVDAPGCPGEIPRGAEDRIVTAAHPFWPGMTIVGWAFSNREQGIATVQGLVESAHASDEHPVGEDGAALSEAMREIESLEHQLDVAKQERDAAFNRVAALSQGGGAGRSEKGEGEGPRRLPFNMDQRAQAAVLADLPPSVAQEAGEHYENAGAPHPKQIKKRDAMAVAWASVLRPYLIGLRDQHDTQARPVAPAQSPSTSDGEGRVRDAIEAAARIVEHPNAGLVPPDGGDPTTAEMLANIAAQIRELAPTPSPDTTGAKHG